MWRGRCSRMQRVGIALVLFVVTACAHRVSSQEPFPWQLRGAVTSVQGSTIRVRHKSGQVVVLTVDDRTVYVKNKQTATSDVVSVGMRVTVDVSRQAGVDRAVRIQISGGGRTAQAP